MARVYIKSMCVYIYIESMREHTHKKLVPI